jgi:hypothetical protein
MSHPFSGRRSGLCRSVSLAATAAFVAPFLWPHQRPLWLRFFGRISGLCRNQCEKNIKSAQSNWWAVL